MIFYHLILVLPTELIQNGLPVYGAPRNFVWTNENDTDGLKPSTENQCWWQLANCCHQQPSPTSMSFKYYKINLADMHDLE